MDSEYTHTKLEFDRQGNLVRIGDYFASEGMPFSLYADGITDFGEPVLSGTGSKRTLSWRDRDGKMAVSVNLEYDESTGIISRRDSVANLTGETVTIRKYAASFPFAPGNYELYSQLSLGFRENVGAWTYLHAGSITLSPREGRPSEGSTPFAVLRDEYSRHALAFLVLPEGDWMLRFTRSTKGGSIKIPRLVAEAGLSDDRLELELAPGESWQAPEILIQILPGREADSGTAAMNRWLNRRYPARPEHFPVVYNTWLDRLAQLDVPRLERQLAAAKRCGCEVFVVDYGWYEDLKAFCRVDDWAECADRAFFGNMSRFADQVRAAGLGFGFWVEMECFSGKSRIVQDRPEWFFPSDHPDIFCPKTWLPEVEDYLVRSLAEAVRRYRAVYVKNDMNHSMGYEPSRLNRYQKGLFRVFARLRELLPEVTFENCSSGSSRLAAGSMMAVFDNHFISDNASPLENLRMFQGMLPRFAPGRIYHWFVGSELRPEPGSTPSFEPGMIVQPQAATWHRMQTEDLNFGLLCNLTGQIGYSCDLASFSPENQDRIAQYSAFYKQYRAGFLRSEAYLLTRPENFEKRRGWLAIQISDPVSDTHFLYAFHCVCDGDDRRIFHPEGLDSEGQYEISEIFPEKVPREGMIRGADLTRSGLQVEFKLALFDSWRGKLVMIRRKQP